MAARREQRAAAAELSEGLGKLMVVRPIEWPERGAVTLEWVRELGRTLDYASRRLLPSELPAVLPVSVLDSFLLAAHKVLLSLFSTLASSDSSLSVVATRELKAFVGILMK